MLVVRAADTFANCFTVDTRWLHCVHFT